MADTVQAVMSASLNATLVRDATATPGASAASRRRTFTEYDVVNVLLDANSFPVPTKIIDISKTLAGTTYDFDFTAAPRADDINVTVDLTGLRLLAILATFADANNVAGMSLGPHPTTNAYAPWGASIRPVFYPHSTLLMFFNPSTTTYTPTTPAVAAGAKAFRIGGAVADVLEGIAIFG